MKHKKQKSQRPNVHVEFQLQGNSCDALSHALIFLLNCKGFSFVDENISYDSASMAQDKLSDNETTLTRGEVRATAKAIDLVLQSFPVEHSEYAYIEDDYPGILSLLENQLTTLQQLQSIFSKAVKDLRKMK